MIDDLFFEDEKRRQLMLQHLCTPVVSTSALFVLKVLLYPLRWRCLSCVTMSSVAATGSHRNLVHHCYTAASARSSDRTLPTRRTYHLLCGLPWCWSSWPLVTAAHLSAIITLLVRAGFSRYRCAVLDSIIDVLHGGETARSGQD